jgi:hypothetical protein
VEDTGPVISRLRIARQKSQVPSCEKACNLKLLHGGLHEFPESPIRKE